MRLLLWQVGVGEPGEEPIDPNILDIRQRILAAD